MAYLYLKEETNLNRDVIDIICSYMGKPHKLVVFWKKRFIYLIKEFVEYEYDITGIYNAINTHNVIKYYDSIRYIKNELESSYY